MVPFEASIGEHEYVTVFNPDIKLLSCDYSLVAPNKVDLRFDINILGEVVSNQSERCVSEISIDYSSSKKAEDIPALTIDYCDKGEEVWDIAKKYNTCPDAIKEENGIDCEIIDAHKVILIPSAN